MTRTEELSALKEEVGIELALIKAKTGYNVQLVESGDQIQVKISMSSTKTIFSHADILKIRWFLVELSKGGSSAL